MCVSNHVNITYSYQREKQMIFILICYHEESLQRRRSCLPNTYREHRLIVIVDVRYAIAGLHIGLPYIPYSGKVWRIDSFRVLGERKFGELIDQPIGY